MTFLGNKFFRAYGFWHWGEGLQTVLFTWYMTFHAELSATEIGFYQALVLSPFLIFAILGGEITDRLGASKSYIVSTSMFAILLIGYGLLSAKVDFSPALFSLYCVLAGIVSAISNPAIDTFIPDATDLKTQDNSLLAATVHNIAKLTGNISGLLLPLLQATGGFVLNGLLMLLSVISLAAHTSQEQSNARPDASRTPNKLRILRRAVRHYRACPENFDLLLSSALLGLLVVPAGYILLPLTLRQHFPQHGDFIALLGMSSWVGAISITALAKAKSAQIERPGKLALIVWGTYGLVLLLLTTVTSFWMLCLLVVAIGGVKVGKALVYGNYLHNCPKGERGLFVAIDQTAFWGLATLGTMGLGILVDNIGLNATIICTSVCVAAGALALAWRGHMVAMRQV